MIEGLETELRAYAARLTDGDSGLLDESEEASGAFVGEELRRMIDRALEEGEVERVLRLPWGEGACFRQTATGRSQGPPGIFFATRTPPMARGAARLSLLALRGVRKRGAGRERPADPPADRPAGERGWLGRGPRSRSRVGTGGAGHRGGPQRTRRPPRSQEAIGPKQRWALDVLRDPGVALPPGAGPASDALGVERSSAVRNALGDVQKRAENGALTADQAAAEIVGVVEEFGLRPVDPPPLPDKIGVVDLGVVCWMAVLPPS